VISFRESVAVRRCLRPWEISGAAWTSKKDSQSNKTSLNIAPVPSRRPHLALRLRGCAIINRTWFVWMKRREMKKTTCWMTNIWCLLYPPQKTMRTSKVSKSSKITRKWSCTSTNSFRSICNITNSTVTMWVNSLKTMRSRRIRSWDSSFSTLTPKLSRFLTPGETVISRNFTLNMLQHRMIVTKKSNRYSSTTLKKASMMKRCPKEMRKIFKCKIYRLWDRFTLTLSVISSIKST
jgi:hypothetical protein